MTDFIYVAGLPILHVVNSKQLEKHNQHLETKKDHWYIITK